MKARAIYIILLFTICGAALIAMHLSRVARIKAVEEWQDRFSRVVGLDLIFSLARYRVACESGYDPEIIDRSASELERDLLRALVFRKEPGLSAEARDILRKPISDVHRYLEKRPLVSQFEKGREYRFPAGDPILPRNYAPYEVLAEEFGVDEIQPAPAGNLDGRLQTLEFTETPSSK